MTAISSRPAPSRRAPSIVLGVLLCALAIVALVAIRAPDAPFAQWIARIIPFAEPHAEAAEAALTRRDFNRAEMETRAELGVSPVRASAWLRLARIDVVRHGRLTSAGASALGHAYDAEPYDLDPGSARMVLALQRYGELSPGLRASVADELGAWALSPALNARLRSLSSTADPAGRAAIALALAAVP